MLSAGECVGCVRIFVCGYAVYGLVPKNLSYIDGIRLLSFLGVLSAATNMDFFFYSVP